LKFTIFVLALASALLAQDSNLEKQLISFQFSNPKAASAPSEYVIQVANDCSATYTESGGEEGEQLVEQKGDDDEEEPANSAQSPAVEPEKEKEAKPQPFQMSEATCHQLFQLAKEADYFNGDFQFRKNRVAYTGDRALAYSAPGVSHRTAFTWSADPRIQQLSGTFEGIASTMEARPKLERGYKFDRLGLNQALGDLLKLADRGWLKEVSLIEPTLRKIANDPKVMNIARQRAQKLLAFAEQQSSPK
jgi:hypothetical protein